MAKLSSLQDLTRVREEIRQEMRFALGTGASVSVGMGTCGIAAGARDTLEAIEAELRRRDIHAQVLAVGCIGMCAKEPLVDIQLGGKSHVLYGNVRPEMVGRLIEQHLLKGQPVKEWVICRMTQEL
jgi:NADP-reducing hydrogenase subunit HndB